MWTTDPASLERARELARRAVALDETLADAHRLLAQIDLWNKAHDTAIAHAERSLALAPGDADGHEALAEVLAWAGQPDESVRLVRQAMRLNPCYPFTYLWTLGHAHFVAGRREDAVEAFSKLVEQNPNSLPAHAYLAVLFTEMGRRDQARTEWDTTTRLSPEASLAILRQRLPYRRSADLDRFLTALRQQGLE